MADTAGATAGMTVVVTAMGKVAIHMAVWAVVVAAGRVAAKLCSLAAQWVEGSRLPPYIRESFFSGTLGKYITIFQQRRIFFLLYFADLMHGEMHFLGLNGISTLMMLAFTCLFTQ